MKYYWLALAKVQLRSKQLNKQDGKEKISNTLKFYQSIIIQDLKNYDEILLIGSGKGVASVKTILQIGWKRKNLKNYRLFLKYFKSEIMKCKPYKLLIS